MNGSNSEIIISWAAGALSFAAIGLLIYMAVTEVFLGKKPVTGVEISAAPEEKGSGKVRTPFLLPAALGIGFLAFLMIVMKLTGSGFRQASGTIYALINVEGKGEFFSWISILLSAVSILFYFCGSVAAYRYGGIRMSVLFCLNPLAVMFAGPYIYSMAAFLAVQCAIFARSRRWWGVALCVGVFVLINLPFTSLNAAELLVLAYTVAVLFLISKVKSLKKESFDRIALAASLVCGAAAMVIAVLSDFM